MAKVLEYDANSRKYVYRDMTTEENQKAEERKQAAEAKREHYTTKRRLKYEQEIDPLFMQALKEWLLDKDRTLLDELEDKRGKIKSDHPRTP
jgi:hypothetical protein